MTHGPEHHIEHAEHAEHAAHAAHHEFDKRVTISIAIIAAGVACVTMLGHRTHNETLQLHAIAAQKKTEASNKWNYYQTKNLFLLISEQTLDQMKVLGQKDANPADVLAARKKYESMVAHYRKKQPENKHEAEEFDTAGTEALEEAHRSHVRTYYFDYGEVALELGVVLSSLAILTKGRGFWYCGLISAVVGAVIVVAGVLDLSLASL